MLIAVTPLLGDEQKAQSPTVERSVESLKTIAEPLATALTELQKIQAEATTTIPEIFREALTAALIGENGRNAVHRIQVEFTAASAYSLDYTVMADFDGSLAPRYKSLERRIQTMCVDVCHARGWVIPFPQITVHQP